MQVTDSQMEVISDVKLTGTGRGPRRIRTLPISLQDYGVLLYHLTFISHAVRS